MHFYVLICFVSSFNVVYFMRAEPEQMSRVENCELHQKGFLNRGRSLLVVVSSPPNEARYTEFTNLVSAYNTKEPFYFTMPSILENDGFHKVSYRWKYGVYIYCGIIIDRNSGSVCIR